MSKSNGGAGRQSATVVLYAVDLRELQRWVGCSDAARFQEAWEAVRNDEDSDWEPQELEVLERLLRRVVFEGQLYAGLAAEERYYLTQLLIDLFDEFVDQEALTDDLPLDALLKTIKDFPRDGDAARLAGHLVRGRELGGEAALWQGGPVEEVLSYLGYVTRDEAAKLVASIDDWLRRSRTRPGGLLKQLRNAADECARAELDLVSFVG